MRPDKHFFAYSLYVGPGSIFKLKKGEKMKIKTLSIEKVRKRFGSIVSAAKYYGCHRQLIYAAITLDIRNAVRKSWADKYKLRDKLRRDCL